MARFTFKCQQCNHTTQITSLQVKRTVLCRKCKIPMSRMLPIIHGTDKQEIVDKYTGITQKPDQRELVDERRAKYYWEHEVPKMVASGVYSIETMLENGWIWVDDNNQIQVHNKPPGKR